ncbi:MAG: hypothetical protein HYU53_08995 [Acidobacteria bacterium]|nr:hypothetical protein [Acidobacteriota bacterium]
MRQAIVLHLAALPALLSGMACSGPVHPQVHADFIAGIRHGATVTVMPAVVRRGAGQSHDEHAARRIAASLQRAGVNARAGGARVTVGEWHVNEARMARESAAALATYVGERPTGTRYALASEYLITSKGQVGGVHAYVVRDDGAVAAILIQNSHHPLFQAARPATPEDCTELVIAAIEKNWITP